MGKCYILKETYFGGGAGDDEDDIRIVGVYRDKQDAVSAAFDLDYNDGHPLPNHLAEIIETDCHPKER